LFSCVLYYIKLHYITLSYYLVSASLLSLLQLFFCLHVRLLYAIKYYLLTYLQLDAQLRNLPQQTFFTTLNLTRTKTMTHAQMQPKTNKRRPKIKKKHAKSTKTVSKY